MQTTAQIVDFYSGEVIEAKKGLGRIYIPDERDKKYGVRKVVPEMPRRLQKYHNASGFWSDQGAFPHCVAHAWLHYVEGGPITAKGQGAEFDTVAYYRRCQQLDEWAGENYDGTSIRAGAKTGIELGLIESYWWCNTISEIVDALYLQPLVTGTDWFSGMSKPNSAGFIKAEGDMEGGHAYVLDGVSVKDQFFRIKNSWGRGWGVRGFAYIHWTEFQKLLDLAGEVCFAIEKPHPVPLAA